jgi:hypothetical protein
MLTGEQENAAHTLFTMPAGTMIYGPDAIHRVTLQFGNQQDAENFLNILCLCLRASVVREGGSQCSSR